MSESVLGSWLLLAGIAGLAVLGAWCVCAVTSTMRAVLVVLCLAEAAASIFTVDVNIPLAASHFRPSGDLAPLWVALLAWLFRVLPLFIPLILAFRRRRSLPAEGTHG
jgi:hypothetical protein